MEISHTPPETQNLKNQMTTEIRQQYGNIMSEASKYNNKGWWELW